MAAMGELMARRGIGIGLDPELFWRQIEPVLAHVAVTAPEWWIAIDNADDTIVGYARCVERGGLFELSELFVRPDRQSAGLGRLLIGSSPSRRRSFSDGRSRV
ncbi:MAG: GNAT family N-acetyltransferase [Chloroflexi bacterium]|nr:GNAT family N-acetyltransferase [Chloroflexota bacterium]